MLQILLIDKVSQKLIESGVFLSLLFQKCFTLFTNLTIEKALRCYFKILNLPSNEQKFQRQSVRDINFDCFSCDLYFLLIHWLFFPLKFDFQVPRIVRVFTGLLIHFSQFHPQKIQTVCSQWWSSNMQLWICDFCSL